MDDQGILSPVEAVLEVVVLVECPTLDNVKVAGAKDLVVLHVIPGSCNMGKLGVFTFLWPELVDSLAFFCCAPLERAGRLVRRSSEERDHLPVRRGKSPSQTLLPPRILKYRSTPPPLSPWSCLSLRPHSRLCLSQPVPPTSPYCLSRTPPLHSCGLPDSRVLSAE